LESLENLINSSPFKKGYIIEKTGMSSPTFYRKLKNHSFTPDEVMEIAVLLNPKEALLEEMKEAEKDYEQNRIMNHEDVMNSLRKEFS
jgi:hypothetical protein